jgi:hypothetical protein
LPTFIQIIEMTTTKAPGLQELMDGWMAAAEGRRSASRSLLTEDRERPDTYVQVVEFPSHQEAMANSLLPETTAFAEKLPALCSAGPTFRNLDLVRVDELKPAQSAGSLAHSTVGPATAYQPEGYRTTISGRSTSSHIADRTADQNSGYLRTGSGPTPVTVRRPVADAARRQIAE